MTETATTRLAPQIVRVLPPESPGISRVVFVVAILALVLILLPACLIPFPANLALVALPTALLLFLVFFNRYMLRRTRRRRAEFLVAFPDLQADPISVRLGKLWQQTRSNPPKAEAVSKELSGADVPTCPSARIICFGPVAIPEVGDVRFEPYIVSATAFLWRRLLSVPIALVVILFWLLQSAHVIPGGRVNLGGFTYVIALGVGTTVTWIWRGAIRPTYVRMAPGIIQVLEYGLRRGKPVIRDYPMEAGTLVLVAPWQKGVQVTLWRQDRKDILPMSHLHNRAEAAERLWQALLSTAPIPRMSDEELIE